MKLRFQRVVFTSLVLSIFSPAALRAQFAADSSSARSVSGQFIVNAGSDISPLLHDPALATNSNYVRLQPALLAISAERFKGEFLRELGMPPNAPWVGTIILSLRPARVADETATLSMGPLVRSWAIQVQMPDVITVPRYSRALAAALLLEYANRSSTDPAHAPEIPGWLADGLGRQIIADDTEKILVSAPTHSSVDGFGANPDG